MKKLILQKNHEMNGIVYNEGAEVEVEDHVYDQIMKSVIADRQRMMAELEEKEAPVKQLLAKEKKESK